MLKTVRKLFTRNRQEQETQDELHFHVEKETEKNIAAGMPLDEARRQALIAFGGLTQTRETLREVHGGNFFEAVLQDARYGLRMLRKTPGFTAVAVLTLALGIGANTAIFSLIDAVIFRSMPIESPGNLLVFEWHAHQPPSNYSYHSFGDCDDHLKASPPGGCSLPLPYFKDVQAQTSVFSHLTAFASAGQLDMSGNGPAKMVKGEFVSGDYFPTLGVHAYMGRLISPSDDQQDAPAVAVLNYGFWQREFGASNSAVGKTIRLNGVSFLIVGVAEPRFDALTLANKYDLWTPMAQRPHLVPRWNARQDKMNASWLIILGRVKPGVSVSQAQAAVSLLFHNDMLQSDVKMFKPENDPAIRLVSAPRILGGTQKQILQPLYVMMMCVTVILLIACANVAGLLLARSAGRQREIAVRVALGAKRGRIVLQLLTESIMLAVAGGILGLLVAIWGAKALMWIVSAGAPSPLAFSPELDWRVLAFTAGISLLTGIVFGLAPALRGSDVGLTSSLKTTSDGLGLAPQGKQRRITAGGMLVSVQMALAIVVLVTAGLFVRTLSNLKALNPGFDTHNVLLFGIDPRLAGYKGAQVDSLFQRLQEKFSGLPGVTAASYSAAPLLAGSLNSTGFHKPGTPPTSRDEKDDVPSDELPVGPKFFSTLHIPLLTGRDFTAADFAIAEENSGETPGSAPTPVIINQVFAEQYFPGVNPVGQIFADIVPVKPDEKKNPGFVIIGVVGNTKYNTLRREIQPTFYSPNIDGSAFFELRTALDPMALVPVAKDIANHENQDLALFRISTQKQMLDRQVFIERITAQLSSFFGLLALVLACLGLYGLLSYEVMRRTREIGIRMAVGAQSHNVIGLVLVKAIALIAGGAAIGIGVALGVTRFLASFLYGVKAGDPITLLAV
ncbi:MAG TPA: ABC transporter permease, partial [Candidatus Angelobacter sp.]|nr:ABC transporter permease [Candidatus Angelobacter sp.]